MSAHGGLEQLQVVADLPIPESTSPTSVRLRMHAVALNHLDLFVLGGLPGRTPTPNRIVCADGAGVIDALGPAVSGLAVGDRVELMPGYAPTTVNFYDVYYVVADGRVVDVWPVLARYGSATAGVGPAPG